MKSLGILILLAVSGVADAQKPPAAAASRPAATPWKVAGLTLGMTPAEVAATMKAAG